MRREVLVSLIAGATLVACATPPAPSPEPAMDWFLSQADGEGVKLAYGPPNSDDVPVMLSCQRRSGRVQVSVSGPDQVVVGAVIELRSGAAQSRLKSTQVEGEGLGARFESTTSARDPVLENFGASGRLHVRLFGYGGATPAKDPALVRHFLGMCRA